MAESRRHYRAYVGRGGVEVRAQPSADAPSIARLLEGQEAPLAAATFRTDDAWIAVRTSEGRVGYVPTTEPIEILVQSTVGRGGAALRAEPDGSRPIVRKLPPGAPVVLLERRPIDGETWLLIRTITGAVGWARGETRLDGAFTDSASWAPTALLARSGWFGGLILLGGGAYLLWVERGTRWSRAELVAVMLCVLGGLRVLAPLVGLWRRRG